ncbi:MAG TPA: YceI family protein [Actinomycetes bacterium]|jgi:polyisoprenoid-binding protein YceI|nr:YceI family protein [Actinomycetes bacterium]
MSISEETTTVPQAPPPAPASGVDIWDIDPVHSTVQFVVRHAFTRVRGRFGDVWGVLSITGPPERSTGHVEIAAVSIDTGQEGRDARLRGEEFLQAERFPSLVFHSAAVRQIDDERYTVDGDLTIRDITRPVTLEVRYLGRTRDPAGLSRASLRVRAEIDREDYGPSWNVMLQEGGSLLVGKTVHVELEVQAVRRRG